MSRVAEALIAKWGARLTVTPALLRDPRALAAVFDSAAPYDAIDPVIARLLVCARDQDPDSQDTVMRVIWRGRQLPS